MTEERRTPVPPVGSPREAARGHGLPTYRPCGRERNMAGWEAQRETLGVRVRESGPFRS